MRTFLTLVLAPWIALAVADASAQGKIELKLANPFVAPHPVSQWLQKWGEQVEKRSNGRVQFKYFPGSQMGPVTQHYDLARSGQADVSWFLHGATPGRFPLTELIQLPYTVGSAEIGTKVLNDRALRTKYLDAEHRGVKALMLMTHQPGNIFNVTKPIRSVEDLKGLRVRPGSTTILEFVSALGATPIGMPATEMLDRMQKGTIDAVFTDYGGAGIAFKMGGTVKHVTEMYSYVASFGVGMNPAFYDALPADLKKLVDDTTAGVEKEIGQLWDGLDPVGKKAIVEGGAQVVVLSAQEQARFRKIGADVAEARVKELEGKGLPARAVYDTMRTLSEQHAKSSMSFWK